MAVEEVRLMVKEDGAHVSASTFINAAQKLLSLIKEIESSLAEGKKSGGIEWVISDLGRGSAYAVFRGIHKQSPSLPFEVLHTTFRGLKELEVSPKRPSKFSNDAMKFAKELAAIKSRESETMSICLGVDTVDLTAKTVSHVEEVLAPLEEMGSVEGVLKMITSVRGTYCKIYDSVTGSAVSCYLDETMLPIACRAFNKRVLASGMINYTADGYPTRIRKITEIVEFPSDDELPTLSDVMKLDLDLSGGLSLKEFMEKRYDYRS